MHSVVVKETVICVQLKIPAHTHTCWFVYKCLHIIQYNLKFLLRFVGLQGVDRTF